MDTKQSKKEKSLRRLIDANLNRSLEGMRVCEDFARFIINNRVLTQEMKKLRHSLLKAVRSFNLSNLELIFSRDIKSDVGKKSIFSEQKRVSLKHIVAVNLQRVKESLRVLEEYLKLYRETSEIKKIRYRLYAFEEKIAKFL